MTEIQVKPIILVLLVLYAGILPLIYFNYNEGRAFYDQSVFHYPTIIHFTESLDFSNYACTSTPGYHLILAFVNKWIFSSELVLKVVNSIFTASIFVIFARVLGQSFSPIKTVVICLPAITSIYIFPAGVWLIPDNLSWLTILLVVHLVMKPYQNYRSFWLCGVFFAISILVRQTNIWLSLPIFVSLGINSFEQLGKGIISKNIYYFRTFLVLVPGIVILLMFIYIWGGLVPPRFQSLYQAPNFAVPAFFLSVFLFTAIFYLPFMVAPIKKIMANKSSLYIIAIAFLCGLILSITTDTNWNSEEGRLSGLWNLVKIAPVFGGKSILLIIMTSFGASLLAAWLLILNSKYRWLMISSIVGFITVNTVGHFVYERYFSGFIFIILFLSLPEILKNNHLNHSKWQIVAPSALATINLLVLLRGLQ